VQGGKMRTLERNKVKFWYCTVQKVNGEAVKREIVDENGNATGEYIVMYNNPVAIKANISPATGQSNAEQIGNLENYDKVIVTDDLDCPIDENSVLFIDKEPEYKDAEYNEATAITVTGATVKVPVYDYIVRRVAKSLNSISIAVSKVKVS
jgi:hypothetical protein